MTLLKDNIHTSFVEFEQWCYQFVLSTCPRNKSSMKSDSKYVIVSVGNVAI